MNLKHRGLRLVLVFSLLLSMTGCLEWIHAWQTYLQMREFDQYFSSTAQDEFTIHFKKPKLLTDDFVALARLRPSTEKVSADGRKHWRYLFRKVDKDNALVQPEISFYCDLSFDQENRVNDWLFSKMFLQIAPAEFLEASFRSLGSGEINEDKKQLKTKAAVTEKVAADLPQKSVVLKHLGEPLDIKDEEKWQIYRYQFILDAHEIEEGYEDRAISEVRLMFDHKTNELVKMSGRFAGLKISINYRDFLEDKDQDH